MSMPERYEAAMVLAGAGDAIGYKRGRWEFCTSGITIYEELKELAPRGIGQICVTKKEWPVSDDTLLHIATAEALIQQGTDNRKEERIKYLAEKYVECIASKDMYDRHPGNTCMQALSHLSAALKSGKADKLIGPFDKRGGGCGAAMRSMCIGLLYPSPESLGELVEVSIESARLTHHHPTAYLGSMASALFTSYAIQGKPVIEWGKGLIDVMDDAESYVNKAGVEAQENVRQFDYFRKQWEGYLKLRGISDGKSEPQFPKSFGLYERDELYRQLSYDGMGGASGHDAPMIAYDALLGSGHDWEELGMRSMIHGGDSDSTGTIAGALYGAMYGFEGVSKVNYENVEFCKKLNKLGKELLVLSEKLKKERPVQNQGAQETPI